MCHVPMSPVFPEPDYENSLWEDGESPQESLKKQNEFLQTQIEPLKEIADSTKNLAQSAKDHADAAKQIADSSQKQAEAAVKASKKADVKGWVAICISIFGLLLEIIINFDEISALFQRII